MSEEPLRRRLLVTATWVVVFGVIHHFDHIFRGNHVGWPVIERVTPFTFSLLIYPFLGYGIFVTRRGRLYPRYWIILASALLVLLVFVHFIPLPGYEAPRDIYTPYINPCAELTVYSKAMTPEHREWLCSFYAPHASPLWAVLALADLLVLLLSCLTLLVTAIHTRRLTAGFSRPTENTGG
jgi:hypothetical protein